VSQPTSEEPTIGAALVAKNREARGGKKAEQLLSSAEQVKRNPQLVPSIVHKMRNCCNAELVAMNR